MSTAEQTVDAEVVTDDKPKRTRASRMPAKREKADTSPYALIRTAVDQGAQIETLKELVALHERVSNEEARKAWHAAVAKFQAECPEIPRTKKGRFGKYAPLGGTLAIVRPHLSNNGLSVTWSSRRYDGEPFPFKVCQLAHELGHVSEAECPIIIDESAGQTSEGADTLNSMQKYGIADTYAERYSFEAVAGLASSEAEDTDGGAPSQPRRASTQAQAPSKEEPPHPAEKQPAPKAPRKPSPRATAARKETEKKNSDKPTPERSQVYIVEMKTPRTGTRADGSKWTKYTGVSHEGQEYSTFSDTINGRMEEAVEQEINLDILWKDGRYGRDIVELIDEQGPPE